MSKQLSDKELYNMFNTWIDEAHGDDITIESFTFSASEILRKVDPNAYFDELATWLKRQCDVGCLFESGGDYYSEELERDYDERTGDTDHNGWRYSHGYINHINEGL